jgi:BolA family transcriptional regulator, general stress-responsive regulator
MVIRFANCLNCENILTLYHNLNYMVYYLEFKEGIGLNMKEKIAKLLAESLWPQYLHIRDDSHKHRGHQGTDKTEDTHFAVTIVSDLFLKTARPHRHRNVYKLLKEPLEMGVHALQIHAYTPEEWTKRGETVNG